MEKNKEKAQVVIDLDQCGIQATVAIVQEGVIVKKVPITARLEKWNEEEIKKAFQSINKKIEEVKAEL